MKRTLASTLLLALLWSMLCSVPQAAQAQNAKGSFLVKTHGGSHRVMSSSLTRSLIKASANDFNAVVKVVEDFYNVKHKGLPLLAKAGIKTASAAARLAGGSKRRLAEAGSVKLAFFEDQEFGAKGGVANFRSELKAVLVGRWLPFVQVLSLNDGVQTYIFLRDAGPKYTVLVVTIEEHDAAVVQVDLAPQTLAMLMQDPNEMGKAITDDAARTDEQE